MTTKDTSRNIYWSPGDDQSVTHKFAQCVEWTNIRSIDEQAAPSSAS